MQKQSWSELSPQKRAAAIIVGLIELVLTTVALRDLKRRPREAVRGPKILWLLIAFVQPVGPVIYLIFGRREG